MADYSGAYATPRADLGEALIEFRADPSYWVTPRVLPRITVPRMAATFSAWTRAGLLRNDNVNRAMRSTYNRVEGESKDHSYRCLNYGVETLVDDGERAFFGRDFDEDLQAIMTLDLRINIAQEIRTANLLFSTANFTGNQFTDNSVTDPWTDVSSDIFGQILDAKEKVRQRTGMEANKLLVSKSVFNLMKKNTDLSKNRRNVSVILSEKAIQDSLVELLGLDEIVVGKSVQNTASELKTETLADIWSKNYALVFYCARDGAPLQEPSLGRLIEWEFLPDMLVTSYREEQRKSDVFRVEHFVDEFLYDQAYGQLIKVQP
jgi:hypothetical protein